MDSVSNSNAIGIGTIGDLSRSVGLIVILIASRCQALIPNARRMVSLPKLHCVQSNPYVTMLLGNVCIVSHHQ